MGGRCGMGMGGMMVRSQGYLTKTTTKHHWCLGGPLEQLRAGPKVPSRISKQPPSMPSPTAIKKQSPSMPRPPLHANQPSGRIAQ